MPTRSSGQRTYRIEQTIMRRCEEPHYCGTCFLMGSVLVFWMAMGATMPPAQKAHALRKNLPAGASSLYRNGRLQLPLSTQNR